MNEQKKFKINELRLKIDEIDKNLLEILNKRASTVIEIGKIKKNNKLNIFDPQREKKMYERLLKLNKGPMKNDMVKEIFQSIIDKLKKLQIN